MKPSSTPRLLAALLIAASSAAVAHDSWFARRGALAADEPLLSLGTGNLFPVMESAIGPEYLVRQGCRWPDGQTRPMKPVRMTGTSVILRPGQPGATGCWAQLRPFDIVVAPDKVELYLAEVNATPALRSTWAAMAARGVPWKERYTKHARIELQGAPVDRPQDMVVDIRRVSGPDGGSDGSPASAGTRVGDTLVYEVRRNGQPMVGLRLELRHAASPQGTWHETDAQGRVQARPTASGAWLLRGVDLRLSTTQPDQWESDFLTLAFEVMDKSTDTKVN